MAPDSSGSPVPKTRVTWGQHEPSGAIGQKFDSPQKQPGQIGKETVKFRFLKLFLFFLAAMRRRAKNPISPAKTPPTALRLPARPFRTQAPLLHM
jgi:hypothetical protein